MNASLAVTGDILLIKCETWAVSGVKLLINIKFSIVNTRVLFAYEEFSVK